MITPFWLAADAVRRLATPFLEAVRRLLGVIRAVVLAVTLPVRLLWRAVVGAGARHVDTRAPLSLRLARGG